MKNEILRALAALALALSASTLGSCTSLESTRDGPAWTAVEFSASRGPIEDEHVPHSADDVESFYASFLIGEEGTAELGRPAGFALELGLGVGAAGAETVPGLPVDFKFVQVHAGARYYLDLGEEWGDVVQPYVGALAAWRESELSDASGSGFDSIDSSGVGFVGRAGIDFQVGGEAALGVGWQYASGFELDDGMGAEVDVSEGGPFVAVRWAF